MEQPGSPPPSVALELSSPQGRWILVATVLASGMAMLDGTVVSIALPTLGKDLHAGFAALSWTVNGYLLTLSALILLGGSFGDRFGRRRVFVIGTVWFAVASALCAAAPTIEWLIAGRMLQGVGAALLTPGSLAILTATFRGTDRGRAIGAWSGLGGVAVAIGPLVGGWLVPINWRLVFLINLPIAVLVVVAALRWIPESRDDEMDPHIDYVGAVLAAVGLAGTTYVLVAAGEAAATVRIVGSATLGLAALAGFGLWELRSAHPMLPLDIFASRQFSAANVVTLAVYAALSVVGFILVLDLQVVSGYSPLAAGLAMAPATVCMLLLSSRAGALSARIGPRWPMSIGPLVCAAGVLWLREIGPHATYVRDVLPGGILFGLGLSLTVAPLTTTVLNAAADRHAGVASGVNNAVARAAGLLAVAVLPWITGLVGEQYNDAPRLDAGYRTAMMLAAVLLVVGGLLAVVTISNAPVSSEEQPDASEHAR